MKTFPVDKITPGAPSRESKSDPVATKPPLGFRISQVPGDPPALQWLTKHDPKISTFPLFNTTALDPELKGLSRLPLLTRPPVCVLISQQPVQVSPPMRI